MDCAKKDCTVKKKWTRMAKSLRIKKLFAIFVHFSTEKIPRISIATSGKNFILKICKKK